MKFWKFFLGFWGVVFGLIGTLLFQPTVFCEITVPVAAKLAGWKAQAVSARLSAFGTLEIEGLEAVNEIKSRIAVDTAKVEFDPVKLVTGRPEILRADFKFALLDLELVSEPKTKKKAFPISVPFTLREASVELVEGRLRTETGAWILKSAHAAAEGWDGRTPLQIRLQLGKLDWNGPGQEELVTTTQATAKKSKAPSGEEIWDLKLTTDVSTVVDLHPWNLVAPCQLVLAGQALHSREGSWQVEGLQAVWQGMGGIRLAARLGGSYAASGDWKFGLKLEPTDLKMAGIFLQPRGIQNVSGTVAGLVNVRGGVKQPLGLDVELNGQGVQLASGNGATWPVQPAALGISSQAEWRADQGLLWLRSLAVNLGQANQPADLQLSLDRPAHIQLAAHAPAESVQPASLQWSAQGLELAAIAPLLVAPEKLKVEGGKLSGSGQARFETGQVELAGRVESRAMTAAGPWVQGKLAVQSVTLDFQGAFKKQTNLRLEQVTLRACWEGGLTEDLKLQGKAGWDGEKHEGFLAGDLTTGLTGLGKAWAGAKFWPTEGTAQAHVEFSGNFKKKGAGLLSLRLGGMRWLGETEAAWGAKLSTEIQAEEGTWTLPDVSLQADRAGHSLFNARVQAFWKPAQDTGRVRLDLTQAESDFLVPVLKNFTPEWQWSEASGKGTFEFTRENRHDFVKADLQAAVTVETGSAQRPRPVDFASVQGNIQASWPSGAEGDLAVETLSLVAQHRNGTEALRASLNAPLQLKKKARGEWEPVGTQASSGLVRFWGWPMGIVAPLILPEARENSIAGTLSGFLKVQHDPEKRSLAAQLDLSSPDLTVDLPQLRLPENQINVQADLALGADGALVIQKARAGARQAGLDWLDLSMTPPSHPGLALSGKINLVTMGKNVPALAVYQPTGILLFKMQASDLENKKRKVGFSAEAQNLALALPEIGLISGVEKADAVGVVVWGQEGLISVQEANLNALSSGNELKIASFGYQKEEGFTWEGVEADPFWVGALARPWLHPNRWVDGDLKLGPGFWRPGDHGPAGEIDAELLGARIAPAKNLAPLSVRVQSDWTYETRTGILSADNATLSFFGFRNQPVRISSARFGAGGVELEVESGILDARGLLDQARAWQSVPRTAQNPGEPTQIQGSVSLDQIVLPDVRIGPLKISKLYYGQEKILLESFSAQAMGGFIRGSLKQNKTASQPVQMEWIAEKIPLGAILGPMIQDARGPVGGFADLEFTGQAAGARLEDLLRTLTGQGSLRLYQAHLENLPAIAKALQGTGQFLGSSFIAGSEINGVGGAFSVNGTRISTQDLRASGTALAAGMRGSLDWMSQAIDFQVNLALTREAIQSSGQLQGVMTQLVGNNSDYYTKIPGSASITGTLADPKVQMDVGKMLAEGGINLLLNAPSGVLQGAGGAAGGAAGAAGSILQGVGNLFKGF